MMMRGIANAILRRSAGVHTGREIVPVFNSICSSSRALCGRGDDLLAERARPMRDEQLDVRPSLRAHDFDLVRRDGGWRYGLGVAGLLIGLISAVALGPLHCDVRGMSEVVLLQVVWTCGIGMGFLRQPKDAWSVA
jgi:hypothetical protein